VTVGELSILGKKKRIKPEVYWKTEYMDRVNPVSAAFIWNLTNILMQTLKKGRARYLFLRYEDLINSPELWLAKIVQFACDNRPEAAYKDENLINTDSTSNLATEHTAGGNPNRYDGRAIALQVDDEWHQKMPKVQKTLVTTFTAPLLHKYGYLSYSQERSQRQSEANSCATLTENERSIG